jgi:hypothetical protein
MSAAMPELRTPVMIMVEVSWEDLGGALQKTRACMEDRSNGGACIRVKRKIPLGSRLRIQWRFEQFSGTVKYCRPEGREYLVGIQRGTENNPVSSPASSFVESPEQNSRRTNTTSSDLKNDGLQAGGARVSLRTDDDGSVRREEHNRINTVENSKTIQAMPPSQSMSSMGPSPRRLIHPDSVSQGATAHGRPCIEVDKDSGAPDQVEFRRNRTLLRKEANKKRKPMAHKWLGLAPWHSKPDRSASGEKKENGKHVETGNGVEIKKDVAKENRMPMPQATQSMEKAPASSAREVPAFQVELLPMDDIYRTAGIVSPRKGYSVTKVVEMLNSEHIRGLSKETKRAALLMALDAAGVTIEQVQRDARSRQGALDSYETELKKQAETEWARKAEEITHIQAELESIKAHYTSRISRNMEALARDKARFNSWVTTKEQESQSMAEAVELCLTSPAPEPVSTPQRESGAATAAHA